MRVNRSAWPVLSMIFVGMASRTTHLVLLGCTLGVLWLVLETFDGEVP